MQAIEYCQLAVRKKGGGVRARGTAAKQASEVDQDRVILAVDPDMSGALAVLKYKTRAKDTPNKGPRDDEDLVCHRLVHHTTCVVIYIHVIL